MTSALIHSYDSNAQDIRYVGGKGGSLFMLMQTGLNVPETVVVNSDAFAKFIAPKRAEIADHLAKVDAQDLTQCKAASDTITKLLLDVAVPADIAEEITTWLKTQETGATLAVRSSAILEDGEAQSFAGQFSSFLNVYADQVVASVRACWLDAFAPNAIAYMKRAGIEVLNNPLAVVIQRMITAQSAGVMFQVDPNGDAAKLVVSAGYGLGEGIVSGTVENDVFTYDRFGQSWHTDLGVKTAKITVDPKGGILEAKVSKAQAEEPVLNTAQLQELLDASQAIGGIYAQPQDIEWAFDDAGVLYVLQSRPITTLPSGSFRLFDNANIAESYPGVVLPMTASIVARDYELCFLRALSLLGAPKSIQNKVARVSAECTAYKNGRMYYSMTNWDALIGLLPAKRKSFTSAFDVMVRGQDEDRDGQENALINHSGLFKAWMTSRFICGFLWQLFGQKYVVKSYFKQSARIGKKLDALAQTRGAIRQSFTEFSTELDRFMDLMGIPFVNDFFCTIFLENLRKSLSAEGYDEAVFNQLLESQSIDSAIPAQKMQEMALMLRDNAALAKTITDITKSQAEASAPEVIHTLKDAGFEGFTQDLEAYLAEYGHRSPRELIMEETTYSDRPQGFLKRIVRVSKMKQRPESAQSETEKTNIARPRLSLKTRFFLGRARTSVAVRETTRLDRGLIFGKFRQVLTRLGTELAEDGQLDDPRDIFYLTLQDLKQHLGDFCAHGTLAQLVEDRKAEEARWHDIDMPEKFYAKGVTMPAFPKIGDSTDVQSADRLFGIGCANGTCEGQAVIVHSGDSDVDVDGKILVSKTTDPGWLFLMMSSAGLISERGSLMSHTAIIGREMGIPTIVGARGATQIIKTDEKISMDGKSGEVYLLDREGTTRNPQKIRRT